MKRNHLALVAIITSVIGLSAGSVAAPLYAQGQITPTSGWTPTPRAVSDDEVNRISKGLYCPVCQNVPLEVCETEACARWRDQVRDLIGQGYTEDQIRAYFVQRFGPQTVGTATNPAAQFFTVILPYILIAGFGLIAIGSVMIWRRRRNGLDGLGFAQQAASSSAAEMAPPQESYRAQLEQEVKERD
jgi:cytochrome c-type biogenesis protein CcmH